MELNLQEAAAWYCVRTHSKHEHIAAAWLKRHSEIEVYLPRVRFRRPQSRGLVWFTDALFPSYLFARFELARWVRHIDYLPGVLRVVRFGGHWPAIPDHVIETLRATVAADQVHVIDERLEPGETVRLADGPFHGLEAVVTRVMPARERVMVLLEFLGRRTNVELDAGRVARVGDERLRVFR